MPPVTPGRVIPLSRSDDATLHPVSQALTSDVVKKCVAQSERHCGKVDVNSAAPDTQLAISALLA